MPPRAPSQENLTVADDAGPSSASTNGRPAPVHVGDGIKIPSSESPSIQEGRQQWNTFHWELNLYSCVLLGLVYHFTPELHRVYLRALFAVLGLDVARYYYARGRMSGVPYTLPMVSLLAMLFHPVRFWREQANIAMDSDGLSCNTLMGKFMVFVTDPKKCREVLTGEGVYGVYAHPNAYWLFGPKNLIYLPEILHKRFRAILSPALFGKDALVQYAEAQERVVRRYMDRYAEAGKPIDARIAFRSMAAASSQESFLGPYLTNDSVRQHLEEDILTFTLGFLSFPFPYVGGLRKAIIAKDRIEKTIRDIVPRAREYVQAGNAPRCMMDHWSLAILDAAKELDCDPQCVPCCHDDDMARTVLDFLFAAQDATNSALTYALDVLAAHPDVLQRMRREVEEECGRPDGSVPVVWQKIRDGEALPYCSRVAVELLHHKPPVPMIPHITKVKTSLGGHDIPVGSVVIPSITYSARVSGASLNFDPDREDRDNLFVKTVTFGAGQHKCPGRRYAESLLTVFLAVLCTHYDFERTASRRPTADEFVYFPTVFPNDCEFVVTNRQSRPAANNDG